MEQSLVEKTGKSLAQWKSIVNKRGLKKHGEILNYLKTEHGFTHGFANFVALKTLASDAASFSEDELLTNQYQGKENLLPIYNMLMTSIMKLGNDVEVAHKKANVSLRTGKQFALIQPTTKTRVDLGLKLKDVLPQGILETSGPFGSMCTHRIQLTSTAEISKEVLAYIKEAYDKSK